MAQLSEDTEEALCKEGNKGEGEEKQKEKRYAQSSLKVTLE
jgi:hypothetical protein